MNKIGVFYGSTTGTTEDVARRIAEKLNVPSAHIFEVSKLTEALVNEYDVLVLGSSTWGAGELQDDWYDGVNVLKKSLTTKHKILARNGIPKVKAKDMLTSFGGVVNQTLLKIMINSNNAIPTPINENLINLSLSILFLHYFRNIFV